MYFDPFAIDLAPEGHATWGRFVGEYEFLVITFSNLRRPEGEVKSENVVEPNGNHAETGVLQSAVSFLLTDRHLPDGFDAFIYTPKRIAQGVVQEFGKGLVRPVGHPGTGKVWRLLGVLEMP